MPEYITKEQAKVAFDDNLRLSVDERNMIFDGIDKIPAADVQPVVRCRDCVYFETGKDYTPYCNHFQGLDAPTSGAYCSFGERKNFK